MYALRFPKKIANGNLIYSHGKVMERDAPIWSAPIHIGRYSHYRFCSAFSKRPIKLGRSDDIKSARTIGDVSIVAHRNGENAPSEGQPAEVRGPRGDPHAPSGVPVPELNHWVNSADTHMSEPLETDVDGKRIPSGAREGFDKVSGRIYVKHLFFKIRCRQIIH